MKRARAPWPAAACRLLPTTQARASLSTGVDYHANTSAERCAKLDALQRNPEHVWQAQEQAMTHMGELTGAGISNMLALAALTGAFYEPFIARALADACLREKYVSVAALSQRDELAAPLDASPRPPWHACFPEHSDLTHKSCYGTCTSR